MARKQNSRSLGGISVIALAVLLGVGGGIHFFGLTDSILSLFPQQGVALSQSSKDAADPEFVAMGQSVYAEQCASCHGRNLEGQPNWRSPLPSGRMPAPPHTDDGHTWHHDDLTLFGLTKFGTAKFTGLDIESDMPAFEDKLTDEEIWAALAYIKSQWTQTTRDRHAQINARAERQRQQ